MIFTLPITVKDGAPLGYWLTPILADALSKQFREQGILCYGKLGLRSPSLSMEKVFQGRLDFLNLTCDRRSDFEFKNELLELLKEVCSKGLIMYRKQECYRCPCGCLELPVLIASFAKEKTFTRVGDIYICKVCGESGKLSFVENGFFEVKTDLSLESIRVYPKSHCGELRELNRQLHEQGIPIFRSRETGLRQDDTNIDIEFVWSLLPLLFSRRYPHERIRLVVTNHVLRQAVIALLLARAYNPGLQADLIVSPCVSHPGVLEKWEINRLFNLGFTGDLLRLMLIGSLGWQAKDAGLYDAPATVEYRRFTLLQRWIQEAQTKKFIASHTPDDFLRNLCQKNLAQGLRHVFNPERFEYKTLTGLF